MSAFEFAIYLGLAGTVAQALWHVAVLVLLVVISLRLGRK